MWTTFSWNKLCKGSSQLWVSFREHQGGRDGEERGRRRGKEGGREGGREWIELHVEIEIACLPNKRRAILWCANPPYTHHYPTHLLQQDISLSVSVSNSSAVDINNVTHYKSFSGLANVRPCLPTSLKSRKPSLFIWRGRGPVIVKFLPSYIYN